MASYRFDAKMKKDVADWLAEVNRKLAEAKELAWDDKLERTYLAVDAAHWAKLDAIDSLPVCKLGKKDLPFSKLYDLFWDLLHDMFETLRLAKGAADADSRKALGEKLKGLLDRLKALQAMEWPTDDLKKALNDLVKQMTELHKLVTAKGPLDKKRIGELHYDISRFVNEFFLALGKAFGFDARQIFHSLRAIDLGLEQLLGLTATKPIDGGKFNTIAELIENEKKQLEKAIGAIGVTADGGGGTEDGDDGKGDDDGTGEDGGKGEDGGTDEGGTGEGEGGGGGTPQGRCVVATAGYGSPYAQEVVLLRRWRDEVLTGSAGGRALVAAYYTLSPPVAALIARAAPLRAGVRWGLRPLIAHLRRLGY